MFPCFVPGLGPLVVPRRGSGSPSPGQRPGEKLVGVSSGPTGQPFCGRMVGPLARTLDSFGIPPPGRCPGLGDHRTFGPYAEQKQPSQFINSCSLHSRVLASYTTCPNYSLLDKRDACPTTLCRQTRISGRATGCPGRRADRPYTCPPPVAGPARTAMRPSRHPSCSGWPTTVSATSRLPA
jgi:hypothetical protein